MKRDYVVHYEENGRSEPRPHERIIVQIIANHFKSDVVFLRRYASKTPDLYILRLNTRWELKSPLGGSKYTVQNNLRETVGQSENVILDLTRAKYRDNQGISRAKFFINHERSRIKHLKIITKSKRIVDIK